MANNSVLTPARGLQELLNDIWHGGIPSRSELVQRLGVLSLNDWQVIAAWDAGAMLGLSRGQVVLAEEGKFTISGESDKLSANFQVHLGNGQTSTTPALRYEGTDVTVTREGKIINDAETSIRNPIDLILALEFIRDGLDTSPYLPKEMIARRLSDKAQSLNLPRDYFASLLSWFPAVENFIR